MNDVDLTTVGQTVTDVTKMMHGYSTEIILWCISNISNLIFSVILLMVGIYLCRKIALFVYKGLERKKVDLLLAGFIQKCILYILTFAVILAVASQLGIDTTSFLALLGSMGLAVGLALKNNISSYTSGIILILTRPFTINDNVSIGGVSGFVKAINLSTTVIATGDNQHIIIPNNRIMNDIIINTTRHEERRIDLTIGVGYGDNLSHAKDVINNVLKNDPFVLAEPAPVVAVSNLNTNSVDFVVRPWVKTEDYWDTRFRLLENIKIALDENSISIPYPQCDVHIIKDNA